MWGARLASQRVMRRVAERLAQGHIDWFTAVGPRVLVSGVVTSSAVN